MKLRYQNSTIYWNFSNWRGNYNVNCAWIWWTLEWNNSLHSPPFTGISTDSVSLNHPLSAFMTETCANLRQIFQNYHLDIGVY